jgi:hypothetical protein
MIFPVLIVLVFTYCRGIIGSTKSPEIHYESFNTFPSSCGSFGNDQIKKLGFAPNNSFFLDIITTAVDNKSGSKMELIPLENENELSWWIRNQSAVAPVAAVLFEDIDEVFSLVIYYL